jgi:hypothetical protein
LSNFKTAFTLHSRVVDAENQLHKGGKSGVMPSLPHTHDTDSKSRTVLPNVGVRSESAPQQPGNLKFWKLLWILCVVIALHRYVNRPDADGLERIYEFSEGNGGNMGGQ